MSALLSTSGVSGVTIDPFAVTASAGSHANFVACTQQTQKALSKVSHETEKVGILHHGLTHAVSVDGEHCAQAKGELRDVREQIKLVAKRLTRNQSTIDLYEKECAPLVAAYEAAVAGFRETSKAAAEGHGKCAHHKCLPPKPLHPLAAANAPHLLPP
jgi:hypothetical protein